MLEYFHVDVFTQKPFSGNSLPVFLEAHDLSASQMRLITQELRHFEAIFLAQSGAPDHFKARIFDLSEELPFAGHPIIGAAAVLHRQSRKPSPQTWHIELASKTVTIETTQTGTGYYGLLDQGGAEFLGVVEARSLVAEAFGLAQRDLRNDLPIEVVSTGLAYLVIPVECGALERAHISKDVSQLLRGFGAQFAVLLDEVSLEVRHWNNDGVIEDVATGSAAGTIGAYRLKHGLVQSAETFSLRQGGFVGRPSVLHVRADSVDSLVTSVKVGGNVSFVGRGYLESAP